jgi:multidrug transporter EmrE-like cation transporter
VNNSLLLILLALSCGVAGQLTLKMGMTGVGAIGGEALAQPVQLVLRVITHPLVVVGLGLYVLGAVAWLTVLSRVPLSLAYPMLALSYAITPTLAWLVLGESLTSMRWAGIGTICLGVLLVARS